VFKYLLSNWKYVVTNVGNTEIHGHSVRAEKIYHFFINVPEVSVSSKTLIDIRLLLIGLIY
jgi:hypothetical protein